MTGNSLMFVGAMGLATCAGACANAEDLPQLPPLNESDAAQDGYYGDAKYDADGAAGKGGTGGIGGAAGNGGAGGTSGASGTGGFGGVAGSGGTSGAGGTAGSGGAGGAGTNADVVCTFLATDSTLVDYAMAARTSSPVLITNTGFSAQMLFRATAGTNPMAEVARQQMSAYTWPDPQLTPDWTAVIPLWAKNLTGHYEVSVALLSGKYYLTIKGRDLSADAGVVFGNPWILPATYYDSATKQAEPLQSDTSNETYVAVQSSDKWEVTYTQTEVKVDDVQPYALTAS
ncbi:MAG: hypothetical protein WC956_10710, partial [bacterium]